MKLVKFVIFLFFYSLLCTPSFAGLYIHPRLGYHTGDDSQEGQNYSSTYYGSLLGATFGRNDRFVIGVNINQWTKVHKGSEALSEAEVSLLEMGPMLSAFLNKSQTIFASFAYNMHAKGERTLSDGTSQEISGSSMLGQLGYVVKFSRSIFLGVSMNYHSVSIDSSVVGSTEADETDSYSTIYPSIDLSIRFK